MAPEQSSPSPQKVCLLDTSVQVDRVKMSSREQAIRAMLEPFDWTVATGISLLEFKATVIQECITIHNALKRIGRYTEARDTLNESSHPQHRLRSHIFNNLLGILGSSFNVNEEKDRRMAEQARLLLEMHIPRLYDWFRRKSVDAVLNDAINCTRANEPPEKKTVAFAANLPICKRGKNKNCRIENFIREVTPSLVASLVDARLDSHQLERACTLFGEVAADPTADLSHSNCRNAGDCLIALEGKGLATHAASTNASEWSVLSRAVGYEFLRVVYDRK